MGGSPKTVGMPLSKSYSRAWQKPASTIVMIRAMPKSRTVQKRAIKPPSGGGVAFIEISQRLSQAQDGVAFAGQRSIQANALASCNVGHARALDLVRHKGAALFRG